MNSTPEIIGRSIRSAHSRAYWFSLARKLKGKVDMIDPERRPLKDLRRIFGAGKTVYRASTGGKWGKSSQIVKL